jgi:hypothetical protein
MDEIIGLKEGEAFPETILFTQPHNLRSTDHHHKIASSWAEIEHLLLPGSADKGVKFF